MSVSGLSRSATLSVVGLTWSPRTSLSTMKTAVEAFAPLYEPTTDTRSLSASSIRSSMGVSVNLALPVLDPEAMATVNGAIAL